MQILVTRIHFTRAGTYQYRKFKLRDLPWTQNSLKSRTLCSIKYPPWLFYPGSCTALVYQQVVYIYISTFKQHSTIILCSTLTHTLYCNIKTTHLQRQWRIVCCSLCTYQYVIPLLPPPQSFGLIWLMNIKPFFTPQQQQAIQTVHNVYQKFHKSASNSKGTINKL